VGGRGRGKKKTKNPYYANPKKKGKYDGQRQRKEKNVDRKDGGTQREGEGKKEGSEKGYKEKLLVQVRQKKGRKKNFFSENLSRIATQPGEELGTKDIEREKKRRDVCQFSATLAR